jgi:hypothetical protein
MVVEVVVYSGSRTITSIAVYEYNGGRLTDDPEGEHIDFDEDTSFEMFFADDGYGIWRLVRHEVIGW